MSGRNPALDWLKAIGMLLIVYGHVAAWAPGATLPPINTKQLGVAFFVFASGCTLAADARAGWRLAFRRLFEVYLVAAALAIVVGTLGFFVTGTVQRSNVLPLVGGVNVAFDFFPANPTTWYVGTYIHIILLAAFTHPGWIPTWRQFAGVAAIEVGLRAWLMSRDLHFIPYMLATNWMTVYTLGRMAAPGRQVSLIPAGLLALAAAGGLWLTNLRLEPSFPFWTPTGGASVSWVVTSLAVTTFYVGFTLVGYATLSRVRVEPFGPFRFVADHTLLIFLAHMPVFYALRGGVDGLAGSREAGAALLFLACVLVPGLVSVALHRRVDLAGARNRLEERLFG